MTKFIIGIFLFLVAENYASAQTQAGNLLIGGAIGWNKSEGITFLGGVDQHLRELRIQPLAGFFLKENIAAGLFFNYEYTRTERFFNNNNNSISKSTLITAGPFVRQYISISDIFSFYGQAMLGYTSNKDQNFRGFTTALKPGLTFFATSKIGVDLSVQGLSYNFKKFKNSEATGNELNLNVNLPALNFGFNFYLSR